MKINRKELVKALEVVRPALASKEMIEQTTCFAFINNKVVTYNDEISISYPLEIELEGAVNAEEFYSFVKKVKGEEITFEIENEEILLKAGRSKAGLRRQSEILLPLDEIAEVKRWNKLPDDFVKAVHFCMSACGRDMSKAISTCVHIKSDFVEGSDNIRLAGHSLSGKLKIKENILVPADTISKIIKLIPIEFSTSEGWVHFKTSDGAVISCRTFDGVYDDMSSFFEGTGENITFPKEIISILERARIFSKREVSLDESVEILLTRNKIQIKSESASGWFKETAKTNYKGEELTFAIAPYVLVDILSETSKAVHDGNRLIFEGDGWKYITLLIQ